MLTRDLLRFKNVGGSARPQFINPADPELLALAASLLECYQTENGTAVSRDAIDALTAPLLQSHPDQKLAQGINKIIQDRCEFALPQELDYAAIRREVFARSAAALKTLDPSITPEEHRARVADELTAETRNLAAAGIYADLPGNEVMLKSPDLFPRELLERYNCALVQSLLLFSGGLEVMLEGAEPAQLRRLFKYLKFFRLLAKVTTVAGSRRFNDLPDKLSIEIDGPTSLFEQTQKYGLQLASFFPALLDLPAWKLKTTLKIRDREIRLSLDESCGLKGHYRNFGSYVPEEIAMFRKLFQEKSDDWEVCSAEPVFQAEGYELVFPDMSFRNSAGMVFHLELFHRWHAIPLLRRLEYAEKHPELPLIIGVDRALHRDPALNSRLEESPYFQHSGFLFRDFPGVDRVKKCLKDALEHRRTLPGL